MYIFASLEFTWIQCCACVQKCAQLQDLYQLRFGMWGLFYFGDSRVHPHQNFLTLKKISLSYLPLMLTMHNTYASIAPATTTLFSYLPIDYFW